MKIEDIIGDYKNFLDQIFSYLLQAGLELSEFSELDHIAYRVESVEDYNAKKLLLNEMGTLISELIIDGRPIAVYKLHEPLVYKGFSINCLELPAPKAKKFYKAGLQHIEFVIDTNLEAFVQEHPNIEFEKKLESPHNPYVTVYFSDSSVKFHEKPLLEVVKLQEAAGQ